MKLGFLLTVALLACVSCTKTVPAEVPELVAPAGETTDAVVPAASDASPVEAPAAVSPADAPSPVTP